MKVEDLPRPELLALVSQLGAERDQACDELHEARRAGKQLTQDLELQHIELELQTQELRAAQDALETACQRYADLYDSAPVAYFTFDRQGVIRGLNLAAESLFGRRREHLVGCPFSSVLSFERSRAFAQHLEACVGERRVLETEFALHTVAGLAYVQAITVAIFGLEGEPVGFRCALLDMSARKRAEIALQLAHESELIARAQLEALDHASMAVGELLAREPRADGPSLLELIAELALDLARARGAQITVTVGEADERTRAVSRSGLSREAQDLPVHTFEVAIPYGGRSVGTLSVQHDAADGELPPDARRLVTMFAHRVGWAVEIVRLNGVESRERLRLDLLERASQELSGRIDLDATHAAIERILKLLVPQLGKVCAFYLATDEQLVPWTFAEGDTHAEHSRGPWPTIARNEPSSLLADICRTPRTQVASSSDENASLRADATLSAVAKTRALGAFLLVPLLARTRVLGVVCLGLGSRDLDAAQVACVEELATRCALALDNAALFQELKSAVQSRDNLLAVVSHDLRSPLNAISLTASALAPLPPQRERRKSLRQVELIKRSVDRMDHLIDDLLTAGSIDGGRLSVVVRREGTAELVLEALEAAKPLAKAKSLRIEHALESAMPAVLADRDRILQVFSNLIGNALKFTPAGGTVRLGAETSNGCVRFFVSDTGPGIAVHKAAQIFERYWTSDAAGRGLGLGLFISRGIVEAHGGQLQLESRVGEGSTFSFTIPLARENQDEVAC